MVCAKCQKLSKGTTLATPRVKKKSETYFGSPAGSATSATTSQNGVGKVRCFLAFGCTVRMGRQIMPPPSPSHP